MHENLELDNVQPTIDLEVLAKHFVNICKERSEADGSLKVHKDAAFTENPMEREDIEETVKVKNKIDYWQMMYEDLLLHSNYS